MLIAAGATSFGFRAGRYASVGLLTVLCCTTLVSYWKRLDQFTVYKPNEDWRSAAHFFTAELSTPPHRVTIFALAPAKVLNYYDSRFDEPELHQIQRADVGAINGQSLTARLKRQLKGELVRDYPAQTPGEIYYPARADIIVNTLARSRTKTFFLLRDECWLNNFDNFQRSVSADPRFQLVGSHKWFGLTAYEYTVR